MEDTDREARQLVDALRGLPLEAQDRLQGVSELSEEEVMIVQVGLIEQLPAIQEVSRRLLGEWGRLTVKERVASLLALTAALSHLEP